MSQSPQSPQSESSFLGVAEKTQPDALTAAMVAAALHAIGHPAEVAACASVRESSYNHNYRIEMDGEPAELRVWYDASPAGAAAEMALHRRLAWNKRQREAQRPAAHAPWEVGVAGPETVPGPSGREARGRLWGARVVRPAGAARHRPESR